MERMTVGQLIELLQEFPQDLPVLRADSAWGGVQITGWPEELEFMPREDNNAWVNYYPQLEHDPDEEYFKGVIIR